MGGHGVIQGGYGACCEPRSSSRAFASLYEVQEARDLERGHKRTLQDKAMLCEGR